MEKDAADLIRPPPLATLLGSGGSGKKVFMGYKIQSFENSGPIGLDHSINSWLEKLSDDVELISITKYCRSDGRWHFCTILYRTSPQQTKTSSPSGK